MPSEDFSYQSAEHAASIPHCTVSIFADDEDTARRIGDDAHGVGFIVERVGLIDEMQRDIAELASDIVALDIAHINQDRCRQLSEMDRKIAADGQHLVVSLEFDLLDEVYRCISSGNGQILVTTSRVERLMALISARGRKRKDAVRELEDRERRELQRLNDEVTAVARRISALLGHDDWGPSPAGEGGSVFRFESPADDYRAEIAPRSEEKDRKRVSRPALPDARLVRKIIAHRQARARFFDGELFADPAWDMLLDLTAARVEHKRVSVTSLCIASGVPPTTALRWIGQLVEAGLFQRVEDDADRRRAFIDLSDKGADAMARYFAEVGEKALALA